MGADVYPKFVHVYDPSDPPTSAYPLIQVLNLRRITRTTINSNPSGTGSWQTVKTFNFSTEISGPVAVVFLGYLAAYRRSEESYGYFKFVLDGSAAGQVEEQLEVNNYGNRVDLFNGAGMCGFYSDVSAGEHTLECQVYAPSGCILVWRGEIFIIELGSVVM